MSELTTLQRLLLLFVLYLMFQGGGGSSPPFKADRLSVLVIEESADRGQLSSGQLDAILAVGPGSVRGYIEGHGGEYRVLDKDSEDDLKFSPQWVKDAFTLPRQGEPWMHAATPKTGFSMPLANADEVLSKLTPLGGK